MQYNLATHDYTNPDPWVALALDRSTFIQEGPKEALMRNNALKSRQFLFPIIRPLARISIVLVQLVRILLPRSLTSTKMLHNLIVWGIKTFVHPDAAYLIVRHFNIGTQMLRFIGDNMTGMSLKGHPLTPKNVEDLRDNVFLQHDLNIYNFITQVGAQLQEQGRQIEAVPHDRIDFSAIHNPDASLEEFPAKWHNFLDLQTAIEFYTPLYAAFLSDDDFWRASNSLQLDETIAGYVARIFNHDIIMGLVNNKHPMVPLSTFEAGFRLMLHGLDAEHLYGFVSYMKEKQAKK